MLEEAKQVCPTTPRRLASEGALLVDVRERVEVELLAFDVPIILNIPLSELEQRWSALPKDKEIVLVCQGGTRSLKATYFLQYHGFTRVSNMEGGILKWMGKGFPVVGKRFEAPVAQAACCGGGAAPAAAGGSCCDTAAPAGARSGCC